jgi:hypothetical protein
MVVPQESAVSASLPPPTLDLVLELAKSAADMRHLLALDHAWTGAGRVGVRSDSERMALAALGDHLNADLDSFEARVTFLGRFFGEHAEWVNQQLATALEAEQFTQEQRITLASVLRRGGTDYAAYGVRLAESLRARLPAERDSLRRKAASIRTGGAVSTDLDHDSVCTGTTLLGMALLTGGVVFESPMMLVAGAADIAIVAAFC